MMEPQQRLSMLRQIVHELPSESGWLQICRVLEMVEDPDQLRIMVDYLGRHLRENQTIWQPFITAVPAQWRNATLRGELLEVHELLNIFSMDKPDSIIVAPGEFRMGSERPEFRDELLHKVYLTRYFIIATTPITQGEWDGLVWLNPSRFQREDHEHHPVENVSWEEAVTYSNLRSTHEGLEPCYTAVSSKGELGDEDYQADLRLNRPHGGGYRLPTEAEWEYACKCGGLDHFEGSLDAMAWINTNSFRSTHPVGTRQANQWGLYDMLGQVWEWTQDKYGPYPKGSIRDPTGPKFGGEYVIRGGSFECNSYQARAAFRGRLSGKIRSDRVGFRLVRTVKQDT